jgi:mono/diheme cytochrome c family protein
MVWSAYPQAGDSAVAKALVAAGVDVNAVSETGTTALSYAFRNGPDTPLVQYLRSIGAKEPSSQRLKEIPRRDVPADSAARASYLRERLQPTLDLLQKSSTAFLQNGKVRSSNCISCHQQDLPAVVLELGRARGFRVDDLQLGRQLAAHAAMWDQGERPRTEIARQMLEEAVPDAPVGLGYSFMSLAATRYVRDDSTDAMVHYLLRAQRTNGSWFSYDYRPPLEDGMLVATAWATLGIRDYAPPGREREAAESLSRARGWLTQQTPKRHNEEVFQLLGLAWAGEGAERLQLHVRKLVANQRPDGGWAQLPGFESDAWATGSALFALHDAGKLATSDPAYQRGVNFLLRTQFDDGSWWVRTRTWAFQPHFDGKFPHGKDQWISAAATAWAAAALLFTLEPDAPTTRPPTAQELIAAFKASPAGAQDRLLAAKEVIDGALANVDFVRDIQPLIERSCVGCHGGDKPRGKFNLTSRESLLRGGESADPAVSPGYADESVLIQYVSDKIEDLEMPPLDRREKYPPLTEAEVRLWRTWIDAGAPWPASAVPKRASEPEQADENTALARAFSR